MHARGVEGRSEALRQSRRSWWSRRLGGARGSMRSSGRQGRCGSASAAPSHSVTGSHAGDAGRSG
eukprot:9154359-Alexandrium_andersonii.AAC.1